MSIENEFPSKFKLESGVSETGNSSTLNFELDVLEEFPTCYLVSKILGK